MSVYNQLIGIRSQFDRATDILAEEFDPSNTRFLLISVDLLAGDDHIFRRAITDANAWGFYALKVNKNDYIVPQIFTVRTTLLHGVWIVGGKVETLLFKLKYSKLIIMTVNKATMDQCVKVIGDTSYYDTSPMIGVPPEYIVPRKEHDFMEKLARVAVVKKAIEHYSEHYSLETY